MPHRPEQLTVAERVIPGEYNLAYLDLWAFIDFENQNHRVARRNLFKLRGHACELVAVFAEQILQHHFGLLDARGVELAFYRQSDFLFLEPVQNIRFRNGVDSVVTDAPDHRSLFYLEYNDFPARPLRRILNVQLHIFEKLRIPQSMKVSPQRLLVVRIAFAAENARF